VVPYRHRKGSLPRKVSALGTNFACNCKPPLLLFITCDRFGGVDVQDWLTWKPGCFRPDPLAQLNQHSVNPMVECSVPHVTIPPRPMICVNQTFGLVCFARARRGFAPHWISPYWISALPYDSDDPTRLGQWDLEPSGVPNSYSTLLPDQFLHSRSRTDRQG
jgi:hypothetical protein